MGKKIGNGGKKAGNWSWEDAPSMAGAPVTPDPAAAAGISARISGGRAGLGPAGAPAEGEKNPGKENSPNSRAFPGRLESPGLIQPFPEGMRWMGKGWGILGKRRENAGFCRLWMIPRRFPELGNAGKALPAGIWELRENLSLFLMEFPGGKLGWGGKRGMWGREDARRGWGG